MLASHQHFSSNGPIPQVGSSTSHHSARGPTASDLAYGSGIHPAIKAPDPNAAAQAAAASTVLINTIGTFHNTVADEEAHHRQVKIDRDKQGVVGTAEEDIEAGREKVASLWHSLWHQKQTTYLSKHVTIPDLAIWQPVYAKLDSATKSAIRYKTSLDQADMNAVKSAIDDAHAEYLRCHQLVDEYTSRLKSGATGLKIIGTCVMIIAVVATGGAAAAAGAGLLGIAGASAGATFGADLLIGGTENVTGVTKVLGEDDSFMSLLKHSAIDATVTFASVLITGGLSNVFMKGLSNTIAGRLGSHAPQVMEQLGVTEQSQLAEHMLAPLTKFLINTAIGVGTSPLGVAIQTVMSGASHHMTKKEFAHECIHAAIQQGLLQAFIGALTHGYHVAVPRSDIATSHVPAEVNASAEKVFADETHEPIADHSDVHANPTADEADTHHVHDPHMGSQSHHISKSLRMLTSHGSHAARRGKGARTAHFGRGQPALNLVGAKRGVSYKFVRNDDDISEHDLFGNEGPELTDIKQGAAGDCYFDSTIAAYAHAEPEVIRAVFMENGQVRRSATGMLQARFFTKYKDGSFHPVLVPIDGKVPCDARGRPVFLKAADQKVWATLLETAYAKYKNGGWAGIGNGGYANEVMQSLTGRQADEIALDAPDEKVANDVYNRIKSVIDGGGVVVAGSETPVGLVPRSDAAVAGGMIDKSVTLESDKVIEGHDYTVVGVHEVNGQKYVTLRNPWGSTPPGGMGRSGIGDIPLAKFITYYSSLDFCEGTKAKGGSK